MSTPLALTQRRFVRAVRESPEPAFVAGIAGGGKLTAAEAVEVYRRGYPARLTEALGETFEACWRVLGDEDFFDVSRDYIARTPSVSHDLSDYGATFPAYLESRPDLEHAPFLGDLARLEWAFKEVFHARPNQGLSPLALADVVGPRTTFRFGAANALLVLRHRVYGIWKRDRADDTPIERGDWEGEQRMLLYKRDGSEVFARELTAPEHATLAALAGGLTLADAVAAAEGLDAAASQTLFAFVAEERLVAATEEAPHG